MNHFKIAGPLRFPGSEKPGASSPHGGSQGDHSQDPLWEIQIWQAEGDDWRTQRWKGRLGSEQLSLLIITFNFLRSNLETWMKSTRSLWETLTEDKRWRQAERTPSWLTSSTRVWSPFWEDRKWGISSTPSTSNRQYGRSRHQPGNLL